MTALDLTRTSYRKGKSAGLTAVFALIVAIPLYPLLPFISLDAFKEVLSESYYQKVIGFTFFQAIVGSVLSLIFGVPAGWAIWRANFKAGRFTAVFSLVCFVFPAMIAAFMLIRIYGNAGLFAPLIRFFYPEFTGVYGLIGILPVYLFLNIPYAVLVTITGLRQIPSEYLLICQNLGLGSFAVLRRLILPFLKPYLLCAGVVIFCVCFTSFPVVMMMGGGPQYSIMEVEIYRFIRYEFSPESAVALSIIQLICLLPVNILLIRLGKSVMIIGDRRIDPDLRRPINSSEKIWIFGALFLFVLLTVFPLLTGNIALLNVSVFNIFSRAYFWTAVQNSLIIAAATSCISVSLSLGIILLLRKYKLKDYGYSNLIFFISPVIFSTGFFLLFRGAPEIYGTAYIAVIAVNVLIVLPFINGILHKNLMGIEKKYGLLCRTLNISGFNRLRYVDLPAVSSALAKSFSIAAGLAVGEFSVIAMFGTENFSTLPFLIYRLNGQYKTNEAGSAAFWLFVLFILLFILPQFIFKNRKTDA